MSDTLHNRMLASTDAVAPVMPNFDAFPMAMAQIAPLAALQIPELLTPDRLVLGGLALILGVLFANKVCRAYS